MACQLPPSPSLKHLRNEAKTLLKAQQSGDPSCCDVLRQLKSLQGTSDRDILQAELPLADVQFALARAYGFGSWTLLKRHILSLQATPDHDDEQLIVLPGVPSFRGRCGKQCSYVASLEAVLRFHGHDDDYIDLMGLGGLAFRLRWGRATWDDICGGCLHPGASASGCFGGHPDILAEVTGYAYEGFGLPAEGVDKLVALLRAELAEERPVLGLNAHNGSLWCVITGYDPEVLGQIKDEDSPPGMLCRSAYDSSDAEYGEAALFPWELRAIRRTAGPAPREEAVRASVRRAVDLIIGGPVVQVQSGGGWFWHYEWQCALGLSAYDAWAGDLEDVAGIDAMPEAHLETYWQSCAYLYDQLHDARRAAAQYLRRIRPVFSSREQASLDDAAGATDELVDILTDGYPCFPYRAGGYRHPNGWNVTGTGHETFRGRQIPAYAPDWPADVRAEGVDVLRRAKAKEATVLKALRDIAPR